MFQLKREEHLTALRRFWSVLPVAGLALLVLWAPMPVLAWGGQVRLARRYQSGQKMVYATKMHTKAVIHSDPPELQNFLPPLPTNFTMQQQNTVTVKGVHSDGSADIENHFDRFEFQSDLAERAPENIRDPAVKAQQEISEHVAGQDIVAHYDRTGRLLGFEGGEGLFEQLDMAYREPLRQALRFFLEQVGGETLYPEHPVKPGETWKRKLDSPATAAYPYNVEGENTLRYVGKTTVGGIRAAEVEFSFVNVVRPASGALGKAEPLAQLQSHGLGVDMHIDGQGKGRVLLALDDGRVLENHATIHQTLSARLENSAPLLFTKSQPLKLEVQSDSQMDVVGAGK
ncbi:MAG TPA: hypothetical protein VFB30_21345 [Spirochaetia bacterium]|nr:hypothetical protein [Spirochaetia bacterium]